MGHVFVNVTLRGRRSRKVRALVDTGATFLVVSRALAEVLRLPEPVGHEVVELADGTRARVPQTTARVRIDGREAGAVALVVPTGDPLLGVEVLEALGLTVDPIRERLVAKRAFAVRLGGYRTLRAR